ncbi:MAG TPA: hypothetical protein VI873_02925 [Candidatus Peribacteraceae bacterium]|nr:hypothetical protein [Candidatus Peribacteraceae bacterium]
MPQEDFEEKRCHLLLQRDKKSGNQRSESQANDGYFWLSSTAANEGRF